MTIRLMALFGGVALCLVTCSCDGGGNDASSATGVVGAGSAGAGSRSGGAGVVADCENGWCRIPAGSFTMGSPPGEFSAAAFGENQVDVTLTRPFWLQQEELSWGTVRSFGWIESTDPEEIGACITDDCPAGDLTVWEAMAAANELSQQHEPPLEPCYLLEGCTGEPGTNMRCESFSMPVQTVYECEGYRLPTEAEWEYAVRAGTTTTTWLGDMAHEEGCRAEPVLEPIAWYCFNSGDVVHPGGLKQPNPFGLHDTLGNVIEWMHNHFDSDGYGQGPLIDPMGQATSYPYRSFRGGLYSSLPALCRAAARFAVNSSLDAKLGPGAGARLARTVP